MLSLSVIPMFCEILKWVHCSVPSIGPSTGSGVIRVRLIPFGAGAGTGAGVGVGAAAGAVTSASFS